MPAPLLALAPAALQSVSGLFQSIFGGGKAKKAQRQLENLQTPTVENNTSINRYYNEALQKYNVNPYSSSLYRMQERNANRNFNQGLNALQGRRSGLAGISSLTQGLNDSSLEAGTMAEQQKEQRFNQLGSATGMKAEDDKYVFDINKMLPFQKQMQLLSIRI